MSDITNKFCVNTYSYTLDRSAIASVQKISEAGYAAVELMMYPGHLWSSEMSPEACLELRRTVENAGIKITTINMPNIDINIAAASSGMREHSLGILENAIAMASDLGAPYVVVGPGKANPLLAAPKEELLSHANRGLDRLCRAAEKAGTGILMENMPFCFLPSAQDLTDFLDDYGNEDIGIVYDVANGHFIDMDPCCELRLVRDRLKLVHFSDTTKAVYRHDAVGLGDVDFAPIAPVLSEIGYANFPVLEVISRSPDNDILKSAEQLASLGFG